MANVPAIDRMTNEERAIFVHHLATVALGCALRNLGAAVAHPEDAPGPETPAPAHPDGAALWPTP